MIKQLLKKLKSLLKISKHEDARDARPLSTKPITDSLACPYCSSIKFVRRGTRRKKYEKVQLYLCRNCGKTFTPQPTLSGKHYPPQIVFNAISLYNVGYSLEETCRMINVKSQKSKPNTEGTYSLQPSTISEWVKEFEEYTKYARMREYALRMLKPRDTVITSTLAHQQLYRYRFHRAKCALMVQEEYVHRRFKPLQEFLEFVPTECPHQYFSNKEFLRASEAPLTFSKKQMIVRSKQNYAVKLCSFVLQGAKSRVGRHEAVQKFFLYNDSVTVATEVPVYLTREDLEHMRTQLGFQIFPKENPKSSNGQFSNSNDPTSKQNENIENSLKINELPKLITGHIDMIQIRNGQVHILDYKPNAEKVQPIDQLTIYAMALSRLTGLRLYEFKCAWFDEKDYFEFYPLHVLHKPKKGRRRKTVKTKEGTYEVNKEFGKIE